MKLVNYTHQSIDLTYYIKGNNPKWLILSGTHGDEAETAEILEKWVQNNEKALPDFMFIPQVSPTAVKLGTRWNKYGKDVNRSFIEDISDPEALAFMYALNGYRFETCLDMHEDFSLENEFYFYDSKKLAKSEVNKIMNKMAQAGTKMYSGVDDSYDENLGNEVKDGYVYSPWLKLNRESGFISDWLMDKDYAKRVILAEIPGKAKSEEKAKIIDGWMRLHMKEEVGGSVVTEDLGVENVKI